MDIYRKYSNHIRDKEDRGIINNYYEEKKTNENFDDIAS